MSEATAEIGCIVLAAGSARRFGSDKRLAQLPGGNTLLLQSLSRVPSSITRKLVVLRPGDEALAATLPDGWQSVIAGDAALGMGHSLAAALPHAAGWQGALIALADMPFVAPHTFTILANHLRPDLIVVPVYEEQRGNPVAFGSAFFSGLATLQGDQGARALLQAHADCVLRVKVDDPGILRDIDTLDRLEIP